MPELPEVEHIARYVGASLGGRRVRAVRLLDPKLAVTSPAPLVELVGRRVEGVERRGKLIVMRLDRGALVVHLKLTGKLWHERGAAASPSPGSAGEGWGGGAIGATSGARWTRLALDLDDGSVLRVEDMRRFAWVRLVTDVAGLDALLAPIGVEPLDPSFDRARLAALLGSRGRARLKALLLDPTFVAGIGNIYADEALFAARLHPRRVAGSLAPREVGALHRAIVSVLGRALAEREGIAVPDQERVGAGGRGAAARIKALRVFQKDGQPCPRCGAPIERSVVAGRGTYTCPACQVAPA